MVLEELLCDDEVGVVGSAEEHELGVADVEPRIEHEAEHGGLLPGVARGRERADEIAAPAAVDLGEHLLEQAVEHGRAGVCAEREDLVADALRQIAPVLDELCGLCGQRGVRALGQGPAQRTRIDPQRRHDPSGASPGPGPPSPGTARTRADIRPAQGCTG